MADRLVDLQRDLLAVQDDRRDAGRARRRGEQLDRLLGDARGVAGEVERRDVLPARGADARRRAARVGAHLELGVADREPAMPPPRLGELLGARRALGGGEGLVLRAPARARSVRTMRASPCAAPPRRRAAARACSSSDDREGVELARARPVAARGLDGGERPARAPRAGPRRRPARAPSAASAPARRHVAGGREAPAATDPHAHADALEAALGPRRRRRPGRRAALARRSTCRASAYAQRPATAAMRLVNSSSTGEEAIAAQARRWGNRCLCRPAHPEAVALSVPPFSPSSRNELQSLGLAGSVIHVLAALTALVLVILRPETVASVELTAVLAAIAIVIAFACAVAPWSRLPSWAGLLPIISIIGLIAAGAVNRGGNEGFYPFFFTYAAMMGGYYCTRRQTLVVIALIIVAAALPIFYSDQGTTWDQITWWVVIAGLAAAVATALQQARERARQGAVAAEALARQDSLTGVSNRRGFEERAADEIARARRHRRELTVLYVDLDGFKTVNDTAGHATGDDVLRRCAQGMASALRGEDFIARIGGDEFGVVLSESGVEGARRCAARLISAVERVATPGTASAGLSASIGWACFPDDGRTVDDLLDVADHALGQVKRERTVTGSRAASPVAFLGGVPGLRGAAAAPMLVPELAAAPAEEQPRWDFASTRRWYAGLAAAAAALWFAAPLLVGPVAGRLPLIAIGMVLTAIWTAAAARHTVGSERVGWALLSVASVIGFIPYVGMVAGAAAAIGVALIVMDRARLRDRFLMIDAACVLITCGLFAGAFLVPSLIDRLGWRAELPASLLQAPRWSSR